MILTTPDANCDPPHYTLYSTPALQSFELAAQIISSTAFIARKVARRFPTCNDQQHPRNTCNPSGLVGFAKRNQLK